MKSPKAIMMYGQVMTVCADVMNGTAGIFPPKMPNVPYHNGS